MTSAIDHFTQQGSAQQRLSTQEKPVILLIDESRSQVSADLASMSCQLEHLVDCSQLGDHVNHTSRLPSLIIVNSHSKMVNPHRLLIRLKQSELSKTIPVMLFCDCENTCPDDKIKAFTLGCDDYVTLPIDSRELIARVQSKVQSSLTHENVANMAYKDELSGLVNRRGYNNALANEWARCKRVKKTISMLIIDIDNFKEFNDKFGHASGDDLILLASETLLSVRNRSSDVVARYGGDEFIFLLPDCAYDGATKIANELVERFNQLCGSAHALVKIGDLSISIGVSSLIPSARNNASELFSMADDALYKAKREGKNCWKRAN
ncbi:diguanylate cyclase [Glaciecola sp. MH2013]|uniref:GGDEF domain-containing response regulator n=1 Tax=Glaciecola sp. MH2013 TaxID=2785524 RepID=UPI00189CB1D2|nr:diguanylate cyclase [Glaciecola sp. MH2013]MBF7074157.1 diguanylate cyclase [Glaciecola sp. MH2013]